MELFELVCNAQACGTYSRLDIPVKNQLSSCRAERLTDRAPVDHLLCCSQDLTFASVKSTDNFPLLDSFHWEIQRMYAAPAFTVKVSHRLLFTCIFSCYVRADGCVLEGFYFGCPCVPQVGAFSLTPTAVGSGSFRSRSCARVSCKAVVGASTSPSPRTLPFLPRSVLPESQKALTDLVVPTTSGTKYQVCFCVRHLLDSSPMSHPLSMVMVNLSA